MGGGKLGRKKNHLTKKKHEVSGLKGRKRKKIKIANNKFEQKYILVTLHPSPLYPHTPNTSMAPPPNPPQPLQNIQHSVRVVIDKSTAGGEGGGGRSKVGTGRLH